MKKKEILSEEEIYTDFVKTTKRISPKIFSSLSEKIIIFLNNFNGYKEVDEFIGDEVLHECIDTLMFCNSFWAASGIFHSIFLISHIIDTLEEAFPGLSFDRKNIINTFVNRSFEKAKNSLIPAINELINKNKH